jgi:hypothetical protein
LDRSPYHRLHKKLTSHGLRGRTPAHSLRTCRQQKTLHLPLRCQIQTWGRNRGLEPEPRRSGRHPEEKNYASQCFRSAAGSLRRHHAFRVMRKKPWQLLVKFEIVRDDCRDSGSHGLLDIARRESRAKSFLRLCGAEENESGRAAIGTGRAPLE